MTYRPSGRTARSGRAQAENDVFEGLPVKQWDRAYARVSLAPPVVETTKKPDDKWGELPLPRDAHLLAPFTQHLLRLARSGTYGMKRKRDNENSDANDQDGEDADDNTKLDSENRGYLIKKWRHVPDNQLEPEHKHFEFLAKRRKGLPSLYGADAYDLSSVPTRRTKVKRTNGEGLVFIYDVLVGESQTVEGELSSTMTEEELAALPAPVVLGAGSVIEGLGVANEEGVVVVDALRPLSAPRRSKIIIKKKGGPGRGKKRVTFTNPDGSTYTTVVPNATKIVPQPGQTVKHVAKGEIAIADISKEEAARMAAERENRPETADGEEHEDGEGDDDDEEDNEDDDDDDDEDREDGEVTDDEAPAANETQPIATSNNIVTNGHPAPETAEESVSDGLALVNGTPSAPGEMTMSHATTSAIEALDSNTLRAQSDLEDSMMADAAGEDIDDTEIPPEQNDVPMSTEDVEPETLADAVLEPELGAKTAELVTAIVTPPIPESEPKSLDDIADSEITTQVQPIPADPIDTVVALADQNEPEMADLAAGASTIEQDEPVTDRLADPVEERTAPASVSDSAVPEALPVEKTEEGEEAKAAADVEA